MSRPTETLRDGRLDRVTVSSPVPGLRRGRGSDRSPRASRVEVRYAADPRVWEVALKLADGDASRLEVVTYEEVRVSN